MLVKNICDRTVIWARPWVNTAQWGKWAVYSMLAGSVALVGICLVVFNRISVQRKKTQEAEQEALKQIEVAYPKARDALIVWIAIERINDHYAGRDIESTLQSGNKEDIIARAKEIPKRFTLDLWRQVRAQVETLEITSRGLTSLPEGLEQLPFLTTLILDGNSLTEVPPVIEKCQYLVHLSIKNNQLKELPAWIGKLPKLKKLELQNNPLQNPSEIKRRFPNVVV
jgi:hypothetical protein